MEAWASLGDGGFRNGQWGVQNENRAWRALNRRLSDYWFSHWLLDFAQACEMDSRVAKSVHTPFLISHRFLQSIFTKQSWVCEFFTRCANWLSQGVRNFRTPCELIFGIFATPDNFRKVCEMLCFSSINFFLMFFPSLLESTCNSS